MIITYWSQTGNTEAMAKAIASGVEAAGEKVEVLEVSQVSLESLKESDTFALGCPAMGAEVLEECEMEPFVEEVVKFVQGKKVALFGSYGWGDGQWMRDWEDRMKEAGATIINGEGLITMETPDDTCLARCKELGIQMVNS